MPWLPGNSESMKSTDSGLHYTILNCADSISLSHGFHISSLILISVRCEEWMKVLQKHQCAHYAGGYGRMTVNNQTSLLLSCRWQAFCNQTAECLGMEAFVGITCNWIKGKNILTVAAERRLHVPHPNPNLSHKCSPSQKRQETGYTMCPFPLFWLLQPPKTGTTRSPLTEGKLGLRMIQCCRSKR